MNDQSVQFEVLVAAAAALGEGAHRCRFSDFTTAELPGDNVLPDDEQTSYVTTDSADKNFRFYVRHLAAAVDGADAIADARYLRGARLLMADPTLGGRVRRIREISRKWEMERSALQVMAIVVTYEAEFSTDRSDPSVTGI